MVDVGRQQGRSTICSTSHLDRAVSAAGERDFGACGINKIGAVDSGMNHDHHRGSNPLASITQIHGGDTESNGVQ
jgi:hypothetical protein